MAIPFEENVYDNEADILDLNISLKHGTFIRSVYFKLDQFKFSVVRLTPRFSNHLENVGYFTFPFNFEIIMFTRICNNINGARFRTLFLFDFCKLIKNCINRHLENVSV